MKKLLYKGIILAGMTIFSGVLPMNSDDFALYSASPQGGEYELDDEGNIVEQVSAPAVGGIKRSAEGEHADAPEPKRQKKFDQDELEAIDILSGLGVAHQANNGASFALVDDESFAIPSEPVERANFIDLTSSSPAFIDLTLNDSEDEQDLIRRQTFRRQMQQHRQHLLRQQQQMLQQRNQRIQFTSPRPSLSASLAQRNLARTQTVEQRQQERNRLNRLQNKKRLQRWEQRQRRQQIQQLQQLQQQGLLTEEQKNRLSCLHNKERLQHWEQQLRQKREKRQRLRQQRQLQQMQQQMQQQRNQQGTSQQQPMPRPAVGQVSPVGWPLRNPALISQSQLLQHPTTAQRGLSFGQRSPLAVTSPDITLNIPVRLSPSFIMGDASTPEAVVANDFDNGMQEEMNPLANPQPEAIVADEVFSPISSPSPAQPSRRVMAMRRVSGAQRRREERERERLETAIDYYDQDSEISVGTPSEASAGTPGF